jgi:hypothetical protein
MRKILWHKMKDKEHYKKATILKNLNSEVILKKLRVIIVILCITQSYFVQAQKSTERESLIIGTFYQFYNEVIIKVDIQDSTCTESLLSLDNSGEKIIHNKIEIKRGKYSYICNSDIPNHFLVSKLSLIENGNYGIYLMNDYQKDLYDNIDELNRDIEADTTNIQIGTLYCENEFNKLYKLKNHSELSKNDFVNIVKNMIDDLRQTIYSINANDKDELETWVGHHDYIQASNLAKHFIKFGYNPIFDHALFIRLFDNKEYEDALNDANVSLSL